MFEEELLHVQEPILCSEFPGFLRLMKMGPSS